MIDKETLHQWHNKKPFRKPDVYFYDKNIPDLGLSAIWYGPAGPEGDYATEVEWENNGFNVSKYMPLEPHPIGGETHIIKITTFIEADEIINTLRNLKIRLPENVQKLARYAAAIGVAKIASWGGEEDEVEELPQ